MYGPSHDPAVIRHMIDERLAQREDDRRAALARSARPQRPSLLARMGGRLASAVETSLLHRPASRPTARTVRP